MNIRVTGQTQSNNAIANIQRQAASAAKYLDQISSGVRVKAASDDPGNYAAILRARADGLRFDAYSQTMSDATTDLNAGVDALLDVNQALTRARQIAVEGADATTGPDGHAALAIEVDALIDRLMKAANTQVEGKHLFGGTATNAPPFEVTGTDATGRPTAISYVGATDRARVLVGPGQTADTKYVGSEVFQQGGADLFQTLIGLRDTLRSNAPDGAKSQALNQSLAAVEAARDAVTETVGEQSAQLASLEAFRNRMSDLKLASDGRVTDLEGTDMAEAVVRMQEFETALQATMAVTSRIFQPSLLDFLR
jgi:flagellar hook-associated protein 3 FlgL